MGYNLYPRDSPHAVDSRLVTHMTIYNVVMHPGGNINFNWQFDNNKVLLNGSLGSPGPDSMTWSEISKHSGVYLLLYPRVDLSGKQYLVIFKADDGWGPHSKTFQIYQNFDLVGEQTLSAGDDAFAILVDCDGTDATYMFFNLANSAQPLFKEIEILII